MAEQRLDALYPGSPRPRVLRIVAGGGTSLWDGDQELVRPLDSKAFVKAIIALQAEAGAEWAKKLQGTW